MCQMSLSKGWVVDNTEQHSQWSRKANIQLRAGESEDVVVVVAVVVESPTTSTPVVVAVVDCCEGSSTVTSSTGWSGASCVSTVSVMFFFRWCSWRLFVWLCVENNWWCGFTPSFLCVETRIRFLTSLFFVVCHRSIVSIVYRRNNGGAGSFVNRPIVYDFPHTHNTFPPQNTTKFLYSMLIQLLCCFYLTVTFFKTDAARNKERNPFLPQSEHSNNLKLLVAWWWLTYQPVQLQVQYRHMN